MKALFLIFHGFSPHNGISKKIWGQVEGLNRCGIDTRLCYYDVDGEGNGAWKVQDEAIQVFGKGIRAKVRKRMDYRAVVSYVRREQIAVVYMRSFHNANPFTIHMIKEFRRAGCKVVMEIPTFPYDQEYITFGMRVELLIDRLFRRKLAGLLDGIVTFSDAQAIFGQRTIRISNGIDFNEVPLRRPFRRGADDDTVHLLAVAEIHYWHGYDRLIAGLARYTREGRATRVVFHLVGALTGDRERAEILTPIQQNGLEEQVRLYGPLSGSDLDTLFDRADLAIGSLGRHRTGIHTIRTLKNREYAARGIPFVYSESDPDFDGREYVLAVPPDDSPIDVARLVAFSRHVEAEPDAIRESVRRLSWEVQMRHVLDGIGMETAS